MSDTEINTRDAGDDYPVIVKQVAGRFFLSCPALGIIIESHDLEAGYSEVQKTKAEVLERYARAGIRAGLPPTGDAGGAPSEPLSRQLRPFAVKTAVISAIAAVFLVWIVSPVTNAVYNVNTLLRGVMQDPVGIVQRAVTPSQILQAVKHFAVTIQMVTPERKEELRESLRIIATELEPYAAELRPLWTGPSAAAPDRLSPARQLE